jgi:hypothetical protein
VHRDGDIRIIKILQKHLGCDCLSVLSWLRLQVTATRWVVCILMYEPCVLYSFVQFCTVLNSFVQFCTVLYSFVHNKIIGIPQRRVSTANTGDSAGWSAQYLCVFSIRSVLGTGTSVEVATAVQIFRKLHFKGTWMNTFEKNQKTLWRNPYTIDFLTFLHSGHGKCWRRRWCNGAHTLNIMRRFATCRTCTTAGKLLSWNSECCCTAVTEIERTKYEETCDSNDGG